MLEMHTPSQATACLVTLCTALEALHHETCRASLTMHHSSHVMTSLAEQPEQKRTTTHLLSSWHDIPYPLGVVDRGNEALLWPE